MAKNIKLKDSTGKEQIYNDVSSIILKTDTNEEVRFYEDRAAGILNKTITEYIDSDGAVFSIGGYAFASCYYLSRVSFSECIDIGNGAFSSCSSLTDIYFPICRTIGMSAFVTCSSLTSASFPACDNIGSSAFQGCRGLSNVFAMPSSLSNNAFTGCSNLSNVLLATTSATLHNSNAFNNTPISNSTYLGYYGSIYVPSEKVDYFKASTNWIVYADRITALPESYRNDYIYTYEYYGSDITQIPSSRQAVKYVGGYAFQSCKSLSTASFPACINIGEYAFQSCYSLTDAYFPKCLNIESNAFYQCSSLTNIYFPECKYVGSYAFPGCKSISIASFPECVNIGSFAFSSCSSLADIYFPKCEYIGNYAFANNGSGITNANFPVCSYIGDAAFSACSSLVSVSFPMCKYVGTWTFMNCSSLVSVSFPMCKYVGSYVFSNCRKLEAAIFDASSVPTLMNSFVFSSTPITNSGYLGYYGSIYVRPSLVDAFKAADNWSYFADRITSIENLKQS